MIAKEFLTCLTTVSSEEGSFLIKALNENVIYSFEYTNAPLLVGYYLLMHIDCFWQNRKCTIDTHF